MPGESHLVNNTHKKETLPSESAGTSFYMQENNKRHTVSPAAQIATLIRIRL